MTDPNSIFKKGYYRTEAPTDGLTDEQRGMAQNLLKGDNLDRLDHASKTGRKFRPVPVVVVFEYWWVAWGHGAVQCRIERIENGRHSDHQWDEQQRTALEEIKHLRNQGFTVREVKMGFEPQPKVQKRTSERRAILEKLRGFRA